MGRHLNLNPDFCKYTYSLNKHTVSTVCVKYCGRSQDWDPDPIIKQLWVLEQGRCVYVYTHSNNFLAEQEVTWKITSAEVHVHGRERGLELWRDLRKDKDLICETEEDRCLWNIVVRIKLRGKRQFHWIKNTASRYWKYLDFCECSSLLRAVSGLNNPKMNPHHHRF